MTHFKWKNKDDQHFSRNIQIRGISIKQETVLLLSWINSLPFVTENKWCRIYQWPERGNEVAEHLNCASKHGVTVNLLTKKKKETS